MSTTFRISPLVLAAFLSAAAALPCVGQRIYPGPAPQPAPAPLPYPIGNPGQGNVDPDTLPVVDDPLVIQSARAVVPLGDSNQVQLYSGEFLHDFKDFELPGRSDLNVAWFRTYRSRLAFDGPLGYGWTHRYLEFLHDDGSGTIRYYTGRGEIQEFEWYAADLYKFEYDLLSRAADGSFTLRRRGGELRALGVPNGAGIGRLLSITTPAGNSITMTYDAQERLTQVADVFGRVTTLQYYATGRIKFVIEPNGRKWMYSYKSSNVLAWMQLPKVAGQSTGSLFQYQYTAGTRRMSRATFPAGIRFENTYHANGELATYKRGEGSFALAYTISGGRKYIDVTDRNGNLEHFELGNNFYDAGNLYELHEHMNRGINPNSPGAYVSYFGIESAPSGLGLQATVWMPDGRKSYRLYDKNNPDPLQHGNVREERMDPNDGGVPRRTWFIHEPQYQQVKIAIPPEAFASGTLPLTGGFYPEVDVTHPSVAPYVTEHFFDYEELASGVDHNGDGVLGPDRGLIVRTVYPHVSGQPAPAERRIQYNAAGQTIEIVDPRGYRSRYFYWPESDPFGQDAASVPTTEAGARGGLLARVVHDYSEDPAAIDPATAAAHRNRTTGYAYDGHGRIVQKVDPNGNATTFEYDDLGRVTREIAPAPFLYETLSEYDGNGRKIKTLLQNVRADGTLDPANPWIEQRWAFDAIDEVIRNEREVQEGVFEVREYWYDKNENLVLTALPRATSGENPAHLTSVVYDERDLVFARTEGGWTSQFTSLPAHDHIDPAALGLSSSPTAATTWFDHDGAEKVVEVKDAELRSTYFQRDGFAREGTVMFPAGNWVVFTYDLADRRTRILSYDSSGRVRRDESMLYDELGKQTQSQAEYFWWDTTGAPVMLPLLTDGDGDGKVTRHSLYDIAGQPIGFVDDRGLVTLRERDGVGEVYRVVDAAGNETRYVRDAGGAVTAVERAEVEPGGTVKTVTVTRELDELGRLVSESDSLSSTLQYEYDSLRRPTAAVGALGNRTRFEYDGVSRLQRTIRELTDDGTGRGAVVGEQVSTRAYNAGGRLIEFRDGEDRRLTFAYDALDRQILMQYESEPAQIATYTLAGQLSTLQEPNGTTVSYGHDANGNIASLTVTALGAGVDGLVTAAAFVADEEGRIVFADNGVCQVARDFDSQGQLVRETLTEGGVSHSVFRLLDGSGNLVSLDYPASLDVDFVPDSSRDTIGEIRVLGAPYFQFQWAGERLVQRDTLPAAGLLTLTYDAANRLSSLRQDLTLIPGAWLQYLLNRNAAGLKTATLRLHENLGDQFQYDSVYQLTRARLDVDGAQILDPAAPALSQHDLSYDRATNRTSLDVDGATTTYAINALNQVTQAGASALVHDANGNLVADGVHLYSYDHADRLRKVMNRGGTLAEFFYDPFGRRFKKVTPTRETLEISFGHRVMEIRESVGGSLSRLISCVYARDLEDIVLLRSNGVDYFLLRDDQGSTTHVVDSAGSVIESYEYGPFGQPTIRDAAGNPLADSWIGNPSLYTGRRWDAESGLYHLRSRYYRPDLGRFIHRDPVGLAGGDNPYAYTENNPINGSDPLGTTTWEDLLKKADPTGKLQRELKAWQAKAELAGWKSVLTVGLADVLGLGESLIDITKGAIDAWFSIIEAMGPVVVEFMNQVASAADQITSFMDQLGGGDGSPAGTYTFEINGQSVTVEYDGGINSSGIVTFPDGTTIQFYGNGDMEGKIPAGKDSDGNPRFDTFSYDASTGVYTYTTADGVVLERFPNGNTVMTLPNGNKFIYDEKGKLIRHCKPGEECPEGEPETQEPKQPEEPEEDLEDDPGEDF